MYGEDKTSLEELKNTVNELQALKIEILPKADKTNNLNNSIEKMENQIKQVDENLLNNTQFATIGNETAENTTEEEQQEIKTSENSNLNILISNIDTLTEKVNQAVSVETERKAEEAKKKTWEQEFAKFEGTYVDIYSNGSIIYTLKADGTLIRPSGTIEKPIGFDRKTDGSIYVQTSFNTTTSNDKVSAGYYLYPIGVGGYYYGDNTKLRLGYSDGVSINICEKQ